MDLFSKVFAVVFSLMPASKRWRYRLEEEQSKVLEDLYSRYRRSRSLQYQLQP